MSARRLKLGSASRPCRHHQQGRPGSNVHPGGRVGACLFVGKFGKGNWLGMSGDCLSYSGSAIRMGLKEVMN